MVTFKKQLEYLKDSLSQIILGLVLFSLSFSGLGIALLLRQWKYSGTVIASFGILTELVALLLCYFIFKGYLKKDEEIKPSEHPKKK
jgi:hypothetical protein